MTRSRKKTPCCHIVKRDGWWKKAFNKRIRRMQDVPDGNAYRRANESWLIDDWKCVMGRRQFEMWLEEEPEDMREPLRRSYIGK